MEPHNRKPLRRHRQSYCYRGKVPAYGTYGTSNKTVRPREHTCQGSMHGDKAVRHQLTFNCAIALLPMRLPSAAAC